MILIFARKAKVKNEVEVFKIKLLRGNTDYSYTLFCAF